MQTQMQNKHLELSELFKMASAVFKKNFAYIAAVTVCVYLPVYIILTLYQSGVVITPEDIQNQDIDKISSYFFPMALSSAGIYILFVPLSRAALTTICQKYIEGAQVHYTDILDNSLMKWFGLAFTSFLFMMICLITSVFIIVPLYFAICFMFYANIVSVSKTWGLKALFQSSRIVKGNWMRTLGITVFIILTVFITSLLFNMLVSAMFGQIHDAAHIITATFIEIFLSYFQIVLTMYFFNLYYMYKRKTE